MIIIVIIIINKGSCALQILDNGECDVMNSEWLIGRGVEGSGRNLM
jgi:hypothetical protein